MPNLTTPFLSLLLLLLLFLLTLRLGFEAEAGTGGRVRITDDLDDVVDDEEDDAWIQWGKKKPSPSSSSSEDDDDLKPSDLSAMSMPEIQAELAKRQTGPAFGFVKLRFGRKRTSDMVSEIAMKWTKVVKTGGIEVNFMGVDLSTIMFTMERGQDVSELKEFVFNQSEAYEIKIGDQVFRRPGDPPLEEVIEKLQKEKKSGGVSKEEL